jgi:hypothetical protein
MTQEKNRLTKKEIIASTIFFIILVASGVYVLFADEPKRKQLTPTEIRQIERNLVERYGSLEEAERVYKEQNDPCNGGWSYYNPSC